MEKFDSYKSIAELRRKMLFVKAMPLYSGKLPSIKEGILKKGRKCL